MTNKFDHPIIDETEIKETVVCGERSYVVPCDVAKEIKMLRAVNLDLQSLCEGVRTIVGNQKGHAVDAVLSARWALAKALGKDVAKYRGTIMEAVRLVANLHAENERLRGEGDLWGAALWETDFKDAKFSDDDLKRLVSTRQIVPEKGAFTAWKKLRKEVVCELLIPVAARRVGGVTGRKCRAEFATVIRGSGVSLQDQYFEYVEGAIVQPDFYDPNPLIECAHGIHFFITRAEAEAF